MSKATLFDRSQGRLERPSELSEFFLAHIVARIGDGQLQLRALGESGRRIANDLTVLDSNFECGTVSVAQWLSIPHGCRSTASYRLNRVREKVETIIAR